jgi:mRNA interferase RelE/StbE
VTFTLKFEEEARAEWDKHCYKIKHNKTGHRLIYQVIDDEVVVLVLAIDKRENLDAYLSAASRIKP